MKVVCWITSVHDECKKGGRVTAEEVTAYKMHPRTLITRRYEQTRNSGLYLSCKVYWTRRVETSSETEGALLLSFPIVILYREVDGTERYL